MDSTRSKGQSAILITDRLILRRWHDSDRHPFARMNADSRVMEFFAKRLSQKDSNSLVDKIEAHFDEHGFGLCAAELRQDGTFIGFIGMSVPDFKAPFSVELGWRLAAEYWGYGLATEGARVGGFEPGEMFTFYLDIENQEQPMLNDSIVLFPDALKVAKEFLVSEALPLSMEWYEL